MPEQRWSRNDRRRHHRVFVKRQAALRRSCAAWGAEHQRYGYSLPCLQLSASPGNVFGGSSPYPGLVNLGSTCYFNAVLQCLLHCEKSRTALLALQSHGASPPARELNRSLAALAQLYVEGERHEEQYGNFENQSNETKS